MIALVHGRRVQDPHVSFCSPGTCARMIDRIVCLIVPGGARQRHGRSYLMEGTLPRLGLGL